MEFTGVELTAPVKKVTAGSMEKAAAGERRGGEEGRWAAALWRGGDAAWRSRGAVESAVAEVARARWSAIAVSRIPVVALL